MPSNEPPETGLDTDRSHTRVSRRHVIFLDALLVMILALLLVLPEATIWAQQQVGQGGHALDGNLQLGSGGYNRRTSAPSRIQRSRYAVGGYAGRGRGSSSRSLYTVNRAGGMSYSRHNAFAPRSRYRSTGYSGNRYSSGYQRRFRY